jgi:uncharacterized protein (TIGR03435 family)
MAKTDRRFCLMRAGAAHHDDDSLCHIFRVSLEARKMTVEVIVVDKLEKTPTEN